MARFGESFSGQRFFQPDRANLARLSNVAPGLAGDRIDHGRVGNPEPSSERVRIAGS
jgi:hypothetical protein